MPQCVQANGCVRHAQFRLQASPMAVREMLAGGRAAPAFVAIASWTSTMRRFVIFILLALFGTAVTVFLVSIRNGPFHDRKRTAPGSDVMTLTVIETESGGTCAGGAAAEEKSAAEVDDDREVCRSFMEIPKSLIRWRFSVRQRAPPMTAEDYVELATGDCNCFRSRLGYFAAADTTAEERAFPIAFSLLTYENVEQTERLLRLVYRPHNAYCVHVDRTADPAMLRAVEAMAACLSNVLVPTATVNVTWGDVTVVHAELVCIERLLAHSAVRWKYFVNLVSRDLPLRTNEELVKILSAYDGANDIDGTRKQ